MLHTYCLLVVVLAKWRIQSHCNVSVPSNLLIQDFFFFLLLERETGREKEREGNIDVPEKHRSVASPMPPTGDLACNPGLCPDREANQ